MTAVSAEAAPSPAGLPGTARSREAIGAGRVLTSLLDALYVVLGGLLAVASAWPIYEHPQAIVAGVAGVGIGVATALAGRLLRLPWGADFGAAAVLYLAVAVPLAVPSLFPSRWLQGLVDAASGVVLGWKQLVTLDLPLGDYEAVLVPLLIVTLFGCYAATRVAVSARRAFIVAPIILIAMYGFGIAFGTSRIAQPYAVGFLPSLPWIGTLAVDEALIAGGALLVLATIGWLALRSRRTRRAAIARSAGIAQARVTVNRASGWALFRRGATAVGMVLVALVLAALVAIPAMGLDRSVIRSGTQPIQLSATQASPLSSYRAWFSDTAYDAPLFTVTAPDDVDRLRLAVMDAYDGTRFVVSGAEGGSRFTRLPGGTSGGGESVTVNVLDGYAGEPWVPMPGDVRGAIDFGGADDRVIDLGDGLYYANDQSSAIDIDPDGGASRIRSGDTITVTGQTIEGAADLIRRTTPSGALHGVDEDAYPELMRWIDLQAPTADGQGLLDLIEALRARGYASHGVLADQSEASAWFQDLSGRAPGYEFQASRSGHSVSRVEELFQQLVDRQNQAGAPRGSIDLADDQSPYVAAIGDDEQFAVAGALIAWAEGFDARVVLGVHLARDSAMLPPDGSEPAVDACSASGAMRTCEGRNVAAWIEVKAGNDWVPLDTSPQVTSLPQANDEGEQPPPHGTQPERPIVDTLDPPVGSHADSDPDAARDDSVPAAPPGVYPALRIAGLGTGAVALVLLPGAVLLVAKLVRRRRRRSGDPEVAIVGAWDEFLDECLDLGIVLSPRGTRRQIATAIGSPVAAQLAAVADLAVFGETVPIEGQRDLAWTLVDEERKALRRGVPFMQRVRAALAPASFLWRMREPDAPRRPRSGR